MKIAKVLPVVSLFILGVLFFHTSNVVGAEDYIPQFEEQEVYVEEGVVSEEGGESFSDIQDTGHYDELPSEIPQDEVVPESEYVYEKDDGLVEEGENTVPVENQEQSQYEQEEPEDVVLEEDSPMIQNEYDERGGLTEEGGGSDGFFENAEDNPNVQQESYEIEADESIPVMENEASLE